MNLVLAGGESHPHVKPGPPQKRAPLPPFDTPVPSPDPPYAPIPVYTSLPPNQVISDGPDPLWWRGNSFAVTIPGLPPVDGTGPNPERCLSWFLDRYSADWQAKILKAYTDRGYTHFTLSLQDSYAAGQSLSQFVQTALSVKAAGIPFVHVQLLSKLWTPQSCTWDNYAAGVIVPAMSALISAGAVDHVSNWEADLIWQTDPGNMQSVIDGIAAICASAPYPVYQWFHGSPHIAGWGPNPYNRRVWWPQQRGKLTGVLFQGRGWAESYPPGADAWPAGDMQARAMDTCTQFAEPSQQNVNGPFRFVYWEDCATQQFYEGACTEDEGDLRGWEAICGQIDRRDFVALSGFGNGCRYPNGDATLKHY